MPRADRYMMEGYTYHLTHRCHNRLFLLRFAAEREAYRKWLRIGAKRYRVPVFAYSITSNHVHVILRVRDREAVARLMDLAAGATARHYNRRKRRSGAFWEGKYHATAIESGVHLWRCLRYVDLNMVRAGKVTHPMQWRWCGYDELMGLRQRYRLIDFDALREQLGDIHPESFRAEYEAGIRADLAQRAPVREAAWTESLAVGSRLFAERITREAGRSQVTYSMLPLAAGHQAWCVRESLETHYSSQSSQEYGF